MNKKLEEKIKKSFEIFKKAYPTWGFGKGPGREDSPDYHKMLNADGTSKVVGNSCFSPRIRMLPVFYNTSGPYQGWTIPHHYRWVLSLHPRLTDGIKETISPESIYEIELNAMTLDQDVEGIISDFLKLTNKEVIKKFNVPYYMFSEESRKIMEDVDRRNALLYRMEESLREYRENNQVRGINQRDEREERLVG